MMKGAGVRTFKHRAGMPVLGIIGKMMNHPVQRGRAAAVGHVDSEGDAGAGAGGPVLDQLHLARGPGPLPSVVERDAELRRRPVRHALLQAEHELGEELRREQDAGSALEVGVASSGARRIVVITPEYNPTAYRADYWIPVRPETDGAHVPGRVQDHPR